MSKLALGYCNSRVVLLPVSNGEKRFVTKSELEKQTKGSHKQKETKTDVKNVKPLELENLKNNKEKEKSNKEKPKGSVGYSTNKIKCHETSPPLPAALSQLKAESGDRETATKHQLISDAILTASSIDLPQDVTRPGPNTNSSGNCYGILRTKALSSGKWVNIAFVILVIVLCCIVLLFAPIKNLFMHEEEKPKSNMELVLNYVTDLFIN